MLGLVIIAAIAVLGFAAINFCVARRLGTRTPLRV